MEEVVFLIQGSKSEPYKVTFEKTENGFKAFCSCAAGKNGKPCKHRNQILQGEFSNILSKNTDEIAKVISWSRAGGFEEIVLKIQAKEAEVVKLSTEIAKLKKELSKFTKGAA